MAESIGSDVFLLLVSLGRSTAFRSGPGQAIRTRRKDTRPTHRRDEFRPAIPQRVARQHCPSPLHRHHQLKSIAASNGIIYHRTVNSLLTVCLTHRDNPNKSPSRSLKRCLLATIETSPWCLFATDEMTPCHLSAIWLFCGHLTGGVPLPQKFRRETNMPTIAFVTPKGGAGKTTSAFLLSTALAKLYGDRHRCRSQSSDPEVGEWRQHAAAADDRIRRR